MRCNKEFPVSEPHTHSFYMCTAGLNSGPDSEEKIKESRSSESAINTPYSKMAVARDGLGRAARKRGIKGRRAKSSSVYVW